MTKKLPYDDEARILASYYRESKANLKALRKLAKRLYLCIYALNNGLAPVSSVLRELNQIREEERKY